MCRIQESRACYAIEPPFVHVAQGFIWPLSTPSNPNTPHFTIKDTCMNISSHSTVREIVVVYFSLSFSGVFYGFYHHNALVSPTQPNW